MSEPSHTKVKFSVTIAAFPRCDTLSREVQEKPIRSHRSDYGRTGQNMSIPIKLVWITVKVICIYWNTQ